MILLWRLAAAAALLVSVAVVAGVADQRLNDARLLYAALGRDRLVAACLPELRRVLVARGFSPAGIAFEPRPQLSLPFAATRTLGADFVFEDGPAATRVDGSMACEVGAAAVRVEVRTAAAPVRFG